MMTRYSGVEHRKRMGGLLRRMREGTGLSQRQLASQLGISNTHILRIEPGRAGASDDLLARYEQRFSAGTGFLLKVKGALENHEVAWPSKCLPMHGTHRIDDLNVTVELTPNGSCDRLTADWTTTLEGASKDSILLRLVGNEDLVHDFNASVNWELQPVSFVNLIDLAFKLDDPIDSCQSVKIAFESRPSPSIRRVLLVPSSGQIFAKTQFTLIWPERWSNSGYGYLQRVDRQLDDVHLLYSPNPTKKHDYLVEARITEVAAEFLTEHDGTSKWLRPYHPIQFGTIWSGTCFGIQLEVTFDS
jgi:transcriptional regulator with XRE-family HTH domain